MGTLAELLATDIFIGPGSGHRTRLADSSLLLSTTDRCFRFRQVRERLSQKVLAFVEKLCD